MNLDENILVIGGGFAGVWSAVGAVRTAREQGVDPAELQVTLVGNTDDLVIRPRLYEADPQAMRVALDRVLGPVGTRRVAATVTGIDSDSRQVTALGRDAHPLTLGYDRLVLAAGSQVVRPELPGTQWLFDIDTLTSAARLAPPTNAATRSGWFWWSGRRTSASWGGARAPTSPRSSKTSASRAACGPRSNAVGERSVTLSDGERAPAATTVWTAGMTASPLTALIPGERDRIGRLVVDAYLRVKGVPGVFAAGDTAAAEAEPGHLTTQSCQHAVPLGRFAGRNVAGDLLGLDLVPFAPDPYVTCLDLGPAGAVVTSGWDRAVQTTGQEAKRLKQQINGDWTYPPVDDADLILQWADHRTTWPTAEVSA